MWGREENLSHGRGPEGEGRAASCVVELGARMEDQQRESPASGL